MLRALSVLFTVLCLVFATAGYVIGDGSDGDDSSSYEDINEDTDLGETVETFEGGVGGEEDDVGEGHEGGGEDGP